MRKGQLKGVSVNLSLSYSPVAASGSGTREKGCVRDGKMQCSRLPEGRVKRAVCSLH